MPIVYVHGVANRRGSGYERGFASLSTYLRRYVAPEISADPQGVAVVDGYWGDLGGRFHWDRASRPPTPLLGMGADATPDEVRLATYAQLFEELHDIPAGQPEDRRETGGLIAAGADGSPPALSDLSPDDLSDLAAAIIGPMGGSDEERATASIVADDLARDDAFRAELAALPAGEQSDHFSQAVTAEVEAAAQLIGQGVGWLDNLKDRLGEVLDRGRLAPGWAAGRVLLEARRPLHDAATLFLGDVFEYLAKRGTAGAPGPIPTRILEALRQAKQISVQRGDEPIVVLSHSMGGQLMYDLVSEFLPQATNGDEQIHVALWCAAASQVGLFEELKLFESSEERFSKANGNKVPFPGSNLSAWWNVWDSSDILSFTAEDIFEGIDDEEYRSGASVIGAHMGYFERPSFFRKLAEKTADAVARV